LDSVLRVLGCLVALCVVAGAAHAGEPPAGNEGVVKWMNDGDGQFFFVDVNANNAWDGEATDAKFRIQGGGETGEMLLGAFGVNGGTSDQLGIMTETKYFIDGGDFSWTPGAGTEGDGFFAPNVGLSQALVEDFNIDNEDDFAKVGTGQFIFVDKNGNKAWDGEVTDAKFRIQGGAETGVLFAGDFGNGPQIGIFTATKVFMDGNALNAPDYSWTPGAGTETDFFFAPNVGAVDAVVLGDFDNDGDDNIGKVAGGFIYLDLNGNFAWDGQPTDAKFRIQGGTLNGPVFAGNLKDTAAGDQAGQFSTTKVFADANGDGQWTPGGGTELDFFFAPNVGGIQAADAGEWTNP
jgi:hypothetical protein